MFAALYTTNFFSTLNDNYQKMLGMLVVTMWVTADLKPLIISIAGAALLLPYIFCSPLASRAAQRWGKQRVVKVCKILEFPIVTIGIIGFLLKDESLFVQHSYTTPLAITLIVIAIFLMGLQSSMYSPAKYGLIRDLGGVSNVSRGMGGMESMSFLGMLLGTAVAAVATEFLPPIAYSSLLLVFALAGYVASLFIRTHGEMQMEVRESLNPFAHLRNVHHLILKYKGLNSVIYILSVFWWFATTIQLCLVVYCQEDMGLTGGKPGMIMCIAAIGVSVGCLLSGWIGNKHAEINRAPLYGLLMTVGLWVLFMLQAKHYIIFTILLFLVAVIGGMFKVPLDAVIQRTVGKDELDMVLAYFNQVSFIFMLGASVTYYLLTLILPQCYVFLMLSIVMLGTSLWLIFAYPPVKTYWKQFRFRKKQ